MIKIEIIINKRNFIINTRFKKIVNKFNFFLNN